MYFISMFWLKRNKADNFERLKKKLRLTLKLNKKSLLQGPNSDVRYSIQSVNPASGTNLFYIFPEDGRIMVSRPLTADKENSRYVVSIAKKFKQVHSQAVPLI